VNLHPAKGIHPFNESVLDELNGDHTWIFILLYMLNKTDQVGDTNAYTKGKPSLAF
jgi:hypothetical protein